MTPVFISTTLMLKVRLGRSESITRRVRVESLGLGQLKAAGAAKTTASNSLLSAILLRSPCSDVFPVPLQSGRV